MIDEGPRGRLARMLAGLHAIEDLVLAGLLGAMVLLAPLQIFLRLFFDTGLTWADPLLRVLVLWVGLLGAVSASRGNRHITIDVLSKLIRPRTQAAVGVVTSVFTAFVSLVVAWHSGQFVATEHEYGSVAFEDLPAWIFESVIPFSFAVIAIRYVLCAALDARVALGLRAPPSSSTHAGGRI